MVIPFVIGCLAVFIGGPFVMGLSFSRLSRSSDAGGMVQSNGKEVEQPADSQPLHMAQMLDHGSPLLQR